MCDWARGCCVARHDRSKTEVCQAGMAGFIDKDVDLGGRSIRDVGGTKVKRPTPLRSPWIIP